MPKTARPKLLAQNHMLGRKKQKSIKNKQKTCQIRAYLKCKILTEKLSQSMCKNLNLVFPSSKYYD